MNDRIEIKESANDGLNEVIWIFWFNDMVLYLDQYIEKSRPTKRHKFTNNKYYSRLEKRYSTITIDDIDIPEYIKRKAIDIFVKDIQVKKWNR